jgi:hypothetical protein
MAEHQLARSNPPCDARVAVQVLSFVFAKWRRQKDWMKNRSSNKKGPVTKTVLTASLNWGTLLVPVRGKQCDLLRVFRDHACYRLMTLALLKPVGVTIAFTGASYQPLALSAIWRGGELESTTFILWVSRCHHLKSPTKGSRKLYVSQNQRRTLTKMAVEGTGAASDWWCAFVEFLLSIHDTCFFLCIHIVLTGKHVDALLFVSARTGRKPGISSHCSDALVNIDCSNGSIVCISWLCNHYSHTNYSWKSNLVLSMRIANTTIFWCAGCRLQQWN